MNTPPQAAFQTREIMVLESIGRSDTQDNLPEASENVLQKVSNNRAASDSHIGRSDEEKSGTTISESYSGDINSLQVGCSYDPNDVGFETLSKSENVKLTSSTTSSKSQENDKSASPAFLSPNTDANEPRHSTSSANNPSRNMLDGGVIFEKVDSEHPNGTKSLPPASPASARLSNGTARSLDAHEQFRKKNKEIAQDLATSFESFHTDITSQRSSELRGKLLSQSGSARNLIRLAHAVSKTPVPPDTRSGTVLRKGVFGWKDCELSLTYEAFIWQDQRKVRGSFSAGDLVGAQILAQDPTLWQVHIFVAGRGRKISQRVKRRHKIFIFKSKTTSEATSWVSDIRATIKWLARVPRDRERKVMVVVNPRSGRKNAETILKRDLLPILMSAEIQSDCYLTEFADHAVDMGMHFSLDKGYEAVVFISGDGTVNQFLNGLLSQPEDKWKRILRTVPLTLICGGTQNGFARALGVPTKEAALYSIVTRKTRSIDVLAATVGDHDPKVHYSLCGVTWGLPGDVAAESEAHRWMGVYRYIYLAIKLGIFKARKHRGRVRYVLTDPQVELQEYDDIADDLDAVEDQYLTEAANIYDQSPFMPPEFSMWQGPQDHVKAPAMDSAFDASQWTEESGTYLFVAGLKIVNTARFHNPSDGNIDAMIVRRESLKDAIQIGWYAMIGKETLAPQVKYLKCKALVIHPDSGNEVINVDGEAVVGAGPYRMEVLPGLVTVLTEK